MNETEIYMFFIPFRSVAFFYRYFNWKQAKYTKDFTIIQQSSITNGYWTMQLKLASTLFYI